MKKLLLSFLAASSIFTANAQCSLIEVPLAQRVSAATLIVEGKVVDQYSYWNSNHTMIYTANEIELYKIFKGNVTTTSIEIITEGGTVGMNRITVEPTLELSVGQLGMFTCEPVQRVKNNITSRTLLPQFEVFASLQGFVKYDAATGTATDPFRTYTDVQTEVYDLCAPAGSHQYITVKQVNIFSTNREQQETQAGPVISGFAPSTLTAGTGTMLTIDGLNFGTVQGGSVVRFTNADDGGATQITPLATEYVSWSATQIKVLVPAQAGTGRFEVFSVGSAFSATPLTVSYAHLNVQFDPGAGLEAYETDHIDDNGSGGYTWRMNTGFDGDASARASFVRAFDTWRCNTGVNWSIGATTSINDAISDGTNIICYDNAAPLPSGVLGVCYSYWSGCASGPTIIWYVGELDIIFDDGSNIAPLTWEYGPALPSGSEYDFETVAVHELGHGHQLGHVISNGAIMHYTISNGTSNRSLGVNDLAGGMFVQGKSVVANVCGPGAMSSMTCGSAPVAAFSASPTTVCVGSSTTFSDLSTNSPISWSWSFTGGTPALSTLQNPVVTYTAVGTYAVSMTATNTSGSDNETINAYITVVPAITVGFTQSPLSGVLCAGQSATLSGTGANSYSWTGGVNNAVSFNPPTSQSYTVTGTALNGCTATAVASFTVNASPTLTVVSNPVNGSVCTGSPATLTANGSNSYSWTGGVTNALAFTPAVTTTYTVTGTGANGCTSTERLTLTVAPCTAGTQLTSAWCGRTNLNLSQWLYHTPISGATNYQYLLTNTVTGATHSRIKGNYQPNMPLSWIPGILYGQTYFVQIRGFVGGQWGQYGPQICTISLANASEQIALNSTSCTATGLTSASYLYCNSVAGATSYKFTLRSGAYTQTQTRTVPNVRLSQFTGLTPNTTYTVTVTEFSGGLWSAPITSPICTITLGGVLRLANQESDEADYVEPLAFVTLLYPNPIGENVTPMLNISGADGQEANVSIVDINGRIVTTYVFFVEGDEYSTALYAFPELVAGIYMMQVQVGEGVQTTKFLVE